MGAGAACITSLPHDTVTRYAERGEKVGERRLTGWAHMAVRQEEQGSVTPDFPKETKCIPICMTRSSFMHIVT
jgi:hypothetical protein